eukprot:CAMPEP_0113331152 /NCGR_PEP_ID=MMETSP0010_2-20120614/22296_1 /TAXON_ID=216773 ORGANISM="Corethron hystrix, Strain 308" /NCGR_SAMPLE_ID=MMETSP0010_2 /ASSEMBLY_ACC=CAM_ASM_000155 /LENGTH=46 /DNA_ID=CAMNT_0000194319 /DNA_START=99 /DNA_END=239 /DNA_ORIENTATION=+ /assembly_acc=CAM_ASM_000155
MTSSGVSGESISLADAEAAATPTRRDLASLVTERRHASSYSSMASM